MPLERCQKVQEALQALPSDAAGIADYLELMGIRGHVDGWRCPISRYITQVTGIPKVWAGACGLTVGTEEIGDVGDSVSIDNPAVGEFIRGFDARLYPNLLER